MQHQIVKTMSKTKLYFIKFNPSEWMSGRISFQPRNIQGAFVQCLCVCFVKEGVFRQKDVDFRISIDEFNKLVELEFVKPIESKKKQTESNGFNLENESNDQFYTIDFIADQLNDYESIREKRSTAGSLGGRGKKSKTEANESKKKQKKADKDKEKEKEKEEEIEIETNLSIKKNEWVDDHPLKNYVITHLSNVKKLEPMTPVQCDDLILKFGSQNVMNVLLAMENKKDLSKKYKSAYLTAKNWLTNNKSSQKTGTNGTSKGEQREQQLQQWVNDGI